MSLPTAPSLLPAPKKKDISEHEKASSDVVPADDDPAQSMKVDDADKDNVDNKADAKNGSDECNNGSTAGEKMETCTEEVYKVRKDDIIAQVIMYRVNEEKGVKILGTKNKVRPYGP